MEHLASANRDHYRIILVGGEPTKFPHLFELIKLLFEALGQRIDFIRIITNGSLSDGQADELERLAELVNIQLVVSIHAEYVNDERLFALIKRLSKRVRVHIKVMLHPERTDTIKRIVDGLILLRAERFFTLEVEMLRMPPQFILDDDRYTSEHYEYAAEAEARFKTAAAGGARDADGAINANELSDIWQFFVEKKAGERIERHDEISPQALEELTDSCVFTGMICCPGANMIDIHPNGMCRGLICDLAEFRVNIFNKNPFMKPDWITGVKCSRECCRNKCNYTVPKLRREEDAAYFVLKRRARQIQKFMEWEKQNGKNQ